MKPGFDMSDLACDAGLPVIMVVGIRLGCINHAVLTALMADRSAWRMVEVEPARESVRRALAILAMPQNVPLGIRIGKGVPIAVAVDVLRNVRAGLGKRLGHGGPPARGGQWLAGKPRSTCDWVWSGQRVVTTFDRV